MIILKKKHYSLYKTLTFLFLLLMPINNINAIDLHVKNITDYNKSSKQKEYQYTVRGKKYNVIKGEGYKEQGIASWYGDDFHNKLTATGELYNKKDMVAAHKTLPLNSIVEVKNLDNNKTLRVRIHDRGPYCDGRIIDLSEYAAKELGFHKEGVTKVEVKFIKMAKIETNFHKQNKHLSKLNEENNNKLRALKKIHYQRLNNLKQKNNYKK